MVRRMVPGYLGGGEGAYRELRSLSYYRCVSNCCSPLTTRGVSGGPMVFLLLLLLLLLAFSFCWLLAVFREALTSVGANLGSATVLAAYSESQVLANRPPPQGMHLVRRRPCSQYDMGSHCLQACRCLLCGHNVAVCTPTSAHSLHLRRSRLCSQSEDPPHSLQMLRLRPCSQMEAPPHCLHCLRRRPCSQVDDAWPLRRPLRPPGESPCLVWP